MCSVDVLKHADQVGLNIRWSNAGNAPMKMHLSRVTSNLCPWRVIIERSTSIKWLHSDDQGIEVICKQQTSLSEHPEQNAGIRPKGLRALRKLQNIRGFITESPLRPLRSLARPSYDGGGFCMNGHVVTPT